MPEACINISATSVIGRKNLVESQQAPCASQLEISRRTWLAHHFFTRVFCLEHLSHPTSPAHPSGPFLARRLYFFSCVVLFF